MHVDHIHLTHISDVENELEGVLLETYLKFLELVVIQRKHVNHHVAAGIYTKLPSENQILCN